ncbi:acyltransferase family protein [Clavibacter tessellarius]|uniref:acyltransferase family protein n=1 Tax=Clavibacter tessellarius TaxID=31965 RepID=UPI0039E99A8B
MSDPRTAVHDDRKLPALTGLRFFAAMTVLLSHFSHAGLVLIPAGAVAFVDGGRTAVALFFVLSGFILAYNYSGMSGTAERRAFYVNRIARIYPVVLLSLALGAIGVAFAIANRDRGYLLEWYALPRVDVVALVVSFLSQASVTTGWFPTARINQPWNGPAWSIACEMFFYLLFPLLVVALRKRTTQAMLWILAAAFLAQVLLIAVVRGFAPEGQRGFLVSQFPITHFFDFLIGVVAALIFLRGGREWLAVGHRRLALISAACLGVFLLSLTAPVQPAYLLLTPFFAALVTGLAVPPRRHRTWLGAGWLLLLGEASFSMYLIHVPLMNLMSVVPAPTWFGWVWILLTVATSVLIFKVFETPSRKFVKRALTRTRGQRKLPEPAA